MFFIDIFVMAVIFILPIYALYRKKTESKRKRIIYEKMAEVIDKKDYATFDLNFGTPSYNDGFEVTFKINQTLKTFTISEFEYAVLEIGDKGLLKYDSHQILSFGDKIFGSSKQV